MTHFRTAKSLATQSWNGCVTKVTDRMPALISLMLSLVVFFVGEGRAVRAQAAPNVAALYQQLGGVGLDPRRVYQVRDASLNHENLHITLEDGTIAFTEDVLGKPTGAFFAGSGEVLLVPIDQAERSSMSLFTGAAVLEEKFTTAYFRFNDDIFDQIQANLRSSSKGDQFLGAYDSIARTLAQTDALRLLITFSRMLPVHGGGQPEAYKGDDRFLHARLHNEHRGTFDCYFDSLTREQISVGQMNSYEGTDYYDTWASMEMRSARRAQNRSAESRSAERKPASRTHLAKQTADSEAQSSDDEISITDYRIRVRVMPPLQLSAEAVLNLEIHTPGDRTLLFELSRFLQVREVDADGHPVEFIHNPSLEGTQRARRGNDLVAVVFPQPLRPAQRIRLRFVYAGEVLSEAGGGLLYVGARGTWYPNRGMAMSHFDLEFRYPEGWMLVATGKKMDANPANNATVQSAPPNQPVEQVGRWVSERPIPVAGFNLGRYVRAEVRSGKVLVESFAAKGVESTFPHPAPSLRDRPVITEKSGALEKGAPPFSPAKNALAVAQKSADAIAFYAQRLGPFPYSGLALTQMPGPNSQGWPGLIFLSSFGFLTAEERANLHASRVADLHYGRLMQDHETAHQWWGDLVIWRNYRDQWISEALSNYCALLHIEADDPIGFSNLLEQYRRNLLEKNKEGLPLRKAGAVSLGIRLSSSKFPNGYDLIAYGRGTWLIHMLRQIFRGARSLDPENGRKSATTGDQIFLNVLRNLQEHFAGKEMTMRDLQKAFEQQLPKPLWYEGRKSLDWFFDGWVNGTSIPRLEIKDIKFHRNGAGSTVSGTIVQDDAPDDLVTSVPIFGSASGSDSTRERLVFLGRVFADGHRTPFKLLAPAGTRKLLVDPYSTVLSEPR